VPSAKYLNTFTPKKDKITKNKIQVVIVIDEIADVIDEKNDHSVGDPLLKLDDRDSYNLVELVCNGDDNVGSVAGGEYISESKLIIIVVVTVIYIIRMK
jgi:hypothetical protein